MRWALAMIVKVNVVAGTSGKDRRIHQVDVVPRGETPRPIGGGCRSRPTMGEARPEVVALRRRGDGDHRDRRPQVQGRGDLEHRAHQSAQHGWPSVAGFAARSPRRATGRSLRMPDVPRPSPSVTPIPARSPVPPRPAAAVPPAQVRRPDAGSPGDRREKRRVVLVEVDLAEIDALAADVVEQIELVEGEVPCRSADRERDASTRSASRTARTPGGRRPGRRHRGSRAPAAWCRSRHTPRRSGRRLGAPPARPGTPDQHVWLTVDLVEMDGEHVGPIADPLLGRGDGRTCGSSSR